KTVLTSKTVLITGANRGIGRAMAKLFASNGFHVLAGVRSLEKAQPLILEIQASGGKIEAFEVDMGDKNSIVAAARSISAKHDVLNAIVNNAAVHVGMTDTILTASDSDIDVSLRTNAFGPLELVKALLPQIKAGHARIVNVSSAAGSIAETANSDSPYAFYDTASYRLSKTMLNGMTGMMAKALRADGVKVNSMCPGWTQTDMGGADAPNKPEQGATIAYKLATLLDDGPTGGFFNEAGAMAW
ncbi:MAG: SDR family NAD(P)-dependent oxidoreductase, partial [Rhizobiaceae bacterium]